MVVAGPRGARRLASRRHARRFADARAAPSRPRCSSELASSDARLPADPHAAHLHRLLPAPARPRGARARARARRTRRATRWQPNDLSLLDPVRRRAHASPWGPAAVPKWAPLASVDSQQFPRRHGSHGELTDLLRSPASGGAGGIRMRSAIIARAASASAAIARCLLTIAGCGDDCDDNAATDTDPPRQHRHRPRPR